MHSLNAMQEDFNIRQAAPEDLDQVYALIAELAEFEQEPGEPSVPLDRFRADFGELYNCLVAECAGGIVGISLYFWGYSTWKGKMLYLDDLVVRESYRRRGIGKALFNRTVELAREGGAGQMRWQVLDWNTPAIDMYRNARADFYGNWLTCKLEKDRLKEYKPL